MEQQHPCVSCSPTAGAFPAASPGTAGSAQHLTLLPSRAAPPRLVAGLPTLPIFQKKHFSKAKNAKATALAVQLLKKHPQRHRSSGAWQGKPERGKVLWKHIEFLPCLFLTLQNVIETTKLAKRVLSAL